MNDIQSTNEEKVHVKLNPTTTSGNPASLDGAAVWEILSGDATVEPDADGLGAFIVSGSAIGASQVKVSADADLGAGVQTIEAIIDYNVVSPQAANLGIVSEPAVPK